MVVVVVVAVVVVEVVVVVAEYRRSLSGGREMSVPIGPASEMCVPKPFSCSLFDPLSNPESLINIRQHALKRKYTV